MGSGRGLSASAATLAAIGCLAVVASPAPAGPPHVRKGTWRPYKPPWDVGAVGRGERSLELSEERNTCGEIVRGLRVGVRETRTDVIVSVHGESLALPQLPGGGVRLCLPPRQVTLRVPLRRRLSGRMIRGREAQVLADPRSVFGTRGSPGEDVAVPNLTGFSPRDAAHALLFGYLSASRRRVGGRSGLPRVVAQGHPPGSMVPRGTAVRLSIEGGEPPSPASAFRP